MSRAIAGRLNGVHAEPGTIVGPNTLGELLVVLENDERGCVIGYATVHEMQEATAVDETGAPTVADRPRSLTERAMRQ